MDIHQKWHLYNWQFDWRLTITQELTILGVTLSDGLSWTKHSSQVRSKMSSRMAVIKRFAWCLNTNNRLLAYNAFIRPHLTCNCFPVWGNTTAIVVNDLNRTLNRCLLTVSGSRTSSLSQVSFNSYDISDFETQVLISNVLTIFHQLQLSLDERVYIPSPLSSSYPTQTSTSNKISITSTKRTADCYCFGMAVPSHWNFLPNEITAISNLNSFKLNYAFLSVVDFFVILILFNLTFYYQQFIVLFTFIFIRYVCVCMYVCIFRLVLHKWFYAFHLPEYK